MKIVFLDAVTMGRDLSLDPIGAVGDLTAYETTEEGEVPERIRDAEVVVVNKVKLTRGNLKDAAKLRLICVAATGYDNIDVSYCREAGIGVCNVVGYSTESVVQVTLSLVMTLATRMPAYTEHVASGAYSRGNFHNCVSPAFYELAGKTWGIVGYGHIGSRVAEVAQALGCRVIGYSRTPKPGVEMRTLEEVCRESHILSLHTPLTDATRGLIGKRELQLMKPGTILINVARGAVTDEGAVAEAVLEGKILFGCDVYSEEPPKAGHPIAALFGHPCACLTPHMAWASEEARERCVAEIALNIDAFQNGRKRNRVD